MDGAPPWRGLEVRVHTGGHDRGTGFVDDLIDDGEWSILGAGKKQMPLATIGAAMGSHVRVGLEDSLWIGPGELAKTNAEQVRRIRTILEALNFEVATPDEAREMLQLKGRENVGF